MKLIIDIDDNLYKAITTEYLRKYPKFDAYDMCTMSDIVCNGIPLEEELKKIKKEIDDLQKAHHIWFTDQDDLINECSEIIDKYIKENKQGVLNQIAKEQKTLLDTTKAWSNYIDKNGNIY